MGPAPLTLLNEEERLFRQAVRQFAEAEIRPWSAEMDRDGRFRPELLRQYFELGLMGIEIPERWGGSGAGFFMSILAVEELSRVDPSAGVICDVQNTLVNNALLRWGTEAQKETYLPRLARDWVGAYALSEAGAGSDAFALRARAQRHGDGWRLDGQKLWITNGAEAELFLLFATVDPAAGYRGITAFLVEKSFPGFRLGKKEDKLGIRASSTCEVILDGCRVPAENVLGEVGKGYRIAMETLNEGRIGIGAQMVGLASGALELAVSYARERTAFGKPIAEFQAVQFTLAEMATELEAARLLVYNAARMKEAGEDFVAAAAQAKYFSSCAAEWIASQSLEIFGGYGYTRDYPIEKLYRDAKIGKIYEGTSNMQLQTIARAILK
jgi:butyryl-CoA dehydrogenase/short/branched chain acyl-CoA dehydrogenase